MNQENDTIIDVTRKPRKCPHCGGKVLPITFGEPSAELCEKAERGEVILGGCCIILDGPDYQCVDCGAQFRKIIEYRNPDDVLKRKKN